MQGLVFSIIGAAGAILIVEFYRHGRTPGDIVKRIWRLNLMPAMIAIICGVGLAQAIASPPSPNPVDASGLDEGGIHFRSKGIGPSLPPLPEHQKRLLIAGIGAFCVWILWSRRG